MTDQPTRCPLCGWQQRMPVAYCECANCGLQISKWPRVADIVAIRDAVLRWRIACDKHGSGHATLKEIGLATEALRELARKELEWQKRSKEAPCSQPDATR